jgi:hypothetical protein
MYIAPTAKIIDFHSRWAADGPALRLKNHFCLPAKILFLVVHITIDDPDRPVCVHVLVKQRPCASWAIDRSIEHDLKYRISHANSAAAVHKPRFQPFPSEVQMMIWLKKTRDKNKRLKMRLRTFSFDINLPCLIFLVSRRVTPATIWLQIDASLAGDWPGAMQSNYIYTYCSLIKPAGTGFHYHR